MLELTDYAPGKSNPVIARRRPGNKGRRYPADPPRVEEIVAVMRQAGTDPYGRRLRGLIVVRWRAGLRISEALALFCVINWPTSGRPWSHPQVRIALRRTAAQVSIRRRFAPHQLRHAHAVEMAREGVPLNVIQRQLGHANLVVTSIYLQGIDSGEIIETVRTRRAPVIPAAAALTR